MEFSERSESNFGHSQMQDENYGRNIYPPAKEELVSLFNNMRMAQTLTEKCNLEITQFIKSSGDNESTMS
jgi:hypothetical protein